MMHKTSITLDHLPEFCYSFFIFFFQVKEYQNILKLTWKLLAPTSNKVFSKSKKRFGTSLFASFSAWFCKKHFTHAMNWPNFNVWLPLHFEISGDMFIVIVCYPVCEVIGLAFCLRERCMIRALNIISEVSVMPPTITLNQCSLLLFPDLLNCQLLNWSLDTER